jgi:hypothetical protein
MLGTSALLSALWMVLFASRFHSILAATPAPAFLPQVTYPPIPSQRSAISFHFFSINARFSQGFFFDWNPPGTTVPIPVTRTLEFIHRAVPQRGLTGEFLQSSAKPCISHGSVGLRA